MKFFIPIMILTSMLAVSACSGPQHTSSGRAAYGDAVPEFKANKKKNQKRKKEGPQGSKTKESAKQQFILSRPAVLTCFSRQVQNI